MNLFSSPCPEDLLRHLWLLSPVPAASPARHGVRRTLAAAALALASLGATCDPLGTPPKAEPAQPTPDDKAPAGLSRFIVSLRRPPGDTTRLTRAQLEAQLSPAALAKSGGRVIDAVPVLNALVVDGVRDPGPLQREPNVISVVLDLEHAPHQP